VSPAEIGLLGIFVLVVFLFLGVHVGFALIIVGFAGLACVIGLGPAIANIALVSFAKVNDYGFAVVPLFLLMGVFVANSGIARDAYDTVHAWVGQIKGGLAIATAGACGLFAACCGSSMAGAVTFGKVAYPEMKRLNYDPRLATGIIAAGGTLGILIPPSIGFIIYGLLTELSIGKLFVAGIIPGILEIVFYAVTIVILCRLNPRMGPAGPKTTVRQKVGSLRLTWPVGVLFVLVIGGIYVGVFTPTEAGGIGAFGALAIALVRRRMSPSNFANSLLETAQTSAMIIIMLIGAFMFNAFLAVTRIPFVASEYIVGLEVSRYVILILILFGYLVLGCFFDIYAIMILTVPIIYPTIVTLGFDGIWYGVIMVRMMEIGLITPPFGLNLFGLAGTVDVPVGTMYQGVVPFVIADICEVVLLVAVPLLSTLLPSLMFG
jgi:tripartite ATP-independent transporter DctM subunit